jgi:hypothetical protein
MRGCRRRCIHTAVAMPTVLLSMRRRFSPAAAAAVARMASADGTLTRIVPQYRWEEAAPPPFTVHHAPWLSPAASVAAQACMRRAMAASQACRAVVD